MLFSIIFAEILILNENGFQEALTHVLLIRVLEHRNSDSQVKQNKEEITALNNLYSVIPKMKH